MSGSYFPRWQKVGKNQQLEVVKIEQTLPLGRNLMMGVQHVVAMFGSTILAPLLMGFDANVAVLMSGVGTLIFFMAVGGRIPSYLGSSFSFIAVVITVTGYSGTGTNPNISVALGAIIFCGFIYALAGFLVMGFDARKGRASRLIERLMPPIVTGGIVAIIGLNLAPVAIKGAMGAGGFDTFMALLTIVVVAVVAVSGRGMMRRLPILIGMIIAFLLYLLLTNGMGFGKPVDFTPLQQAAWIGLPATTQPEFQWDAMLLVAPVVIILIAENLGHVKAVGAMSGEHLDPLIGRAFVGDGIATMVSACFGGTGVTTYAENIGVMAVTRIFSSLVFVIAGIFAILLGFCPKFGVLIYLIPGPVIGGMSIVVFGLIVIAGARIWVVSQVDFSDNRNILTAAVTLILGAGDFSIKIGNFVMNGIGTATFSAILLYFLLGVTKGETFGEE